MQVEVCNGSLYRLVKRKYFLGFMFLISQLKIAHLLYNTTVRIGGGAWGGLERGETWT